jgi:hypothetical protein
VHSANNRHHCGSGVRTVPVGTSGNGAVDRHHYGSGVGTVPTGMSGNGVVGFADAGTLAPSAVRAWREFSQVGIVGRIGVALGWTGDVDWARYHFKGFSNFQIDFQMGSKASNWKI